MKLVYWLDSLGMYRAPVPRGFRIACYDVLYDRALIAPIGLHKLVGYWRRWCDWWAAGVYRPFNQAVQEEIGRRAQIRCDEREAVIRKRAFDEGFKAGRDAILDYLERSVGSKR